LPFDLIMYNPQLFLDRATILTAIKKEQSITLCSYHSNV
jgi:hypothetical protein